MFAYQHFLRAFEKQDLELARSIIVNLLADKPASFRCLSAYVDYLEKAFLTLDMTEREAGLDRYRKAKSRFMTYGYLSAGRLEELGKLDARIEALRGELGEIRQRLEQEARTSSRRGNEEILQYLEAQLSTLGDIRDEKEFDSVLQEVKKAEKKLSLTTMDENERELYDRLIDLYATRIAAKTKEFENAALTEYNLECLDSLKELASLFRKSRRRLTRHFAALAPLLADMMFAYDTDKLFQPTAEYYEYVYSYIFNRLSDRDRSEMARLALSTGKK